MKLSELLKIVDVESNEDKDIQSVTSNIKYVDEYTIFIPINGEKFNSYAYVEEALNKKAIVIGNYFYSHPHYFSVVDNLEVGGMLAHALNGNPSDKVKVIGISGTNGKSSVACFLSQLLIQHGKKTLVIGTDGIFLNEKYISSNQTTPSFEILAKTLKTYHKAVDYIIMEVSSHALCQKRIAGIHFDAIIYTNIGHDHLDYHSSFYAYKNIKLELIKYLKGNGFVVLNSDDKHLMSYLDYINYKCVTYGSNGEFKISDIAYQNHHLTFNYNNQPINLYILGLYNAYNIGAALSCFKSLYPIGTLIDINKLKGMKGRMEVIEDEYNLIIVDYAHTLEAFEALVNNVLFLKKQTDTKTWLVFGLGGNRDKQKRSLIGKVISKMDHIIITSDNNRSESFVSITSNIIKGIENVTYKLIEDRSNAIEFALINAQLNDIIIIAGKGIEATQEINGIKYPFSDYEEINKAIKKRGNLR